MLIQSGPGQLPSASFPIDYSLINLTFKAIKSLATASFVKYTVKYIIGPTDNVFTNESGSLLSAGCLYQFQSVGCLIDHYQPGTHL